MSGDLALVKQGYADLFYEDMKGYAKRCLQFTVEFTSVPQLCRAIRLVKQYENFCGDGVAVVVNMFSDSILSGKFGREYSPVLYLTVKSGTDAQQIIGALKMQQANEVTFTNGCI